MYLCTVIINQVYSSIFIILIVSNLLGTADEKSSSVAMPTCLISNNTVNLGDEILNVNYNRPFVRLINYSFKIKKEESYCDYCCIATRYSEHWVRHLRDVGILILINFK